MVSKAGPRTFDEQKAIAELDRLRVEIESAHRKRVEAEAAFDDFVRGFKSPAAADAAAKELPARPASMRIEQPRPAPEPFVATAAAAPLDVTPQRDVPPVAAPTPHAPIEAQPLPPRLRVAPARRSIRARDVGIAGAGLAVLAAGALVVRGWRSSPQEATAAPPVTAAPANVAPATTPATAPAEPPPPAVPERGLAAQLTATRQVWVRVTVDGERALERELPAGTVLPFRAERTLALRIGDAGAVRLVVNGRDAGPLGPDGQIAVRTFTAPLAGR